MRCKQVRKLLLHSFPTDFAPREHQSLTAHLSGCAACRGELERIQQLDQRIHNQLAATPVRGKERARQVLAKQMLAQRGWQYTASGVVRCGARLLLPFASAVALVCVLLAATSLLRSFLTLGPAIVTPTGRDKLWLVQVSPTTLPKQSIIAFEITIGYTLASTRDATLSLRLAGEPTDGRRYFVEPVVVHSSETQATVRFTLDAERAQAMFGDAPVQIEATLRATTGERVLLASERFDEATYQLR